MKKLYKPIPYRQGNTVLKKYSEKFDDGYGHNGTRTLVDYTTSKGKVVKRFTMFIVWNT